jgi:hypothetical protein
MHILNDHGVNLVTDFDASIRLLARIEQSCYEFPALERVDYPSE